jgi:membrane-bound ClpP family serine protease
MFDPILSLIGVIFFILVIIRHESKDKDNPIIGIFILVLMFITLYYCYKNYILY